MHEITKNIEEEKTATKGNQLKKIIAKFILSHPNDTIQASDSVDYFRQRLNNETTVDQAQTRVLTKLFTFPLTLSYGINKLFPECNRGSDLENLQILILGGRSESSLPMTWWKEALYSTKKIPRNILIRIIGPDIAITPKDSTVTWVSDNSSHLSTLTISRLDKIDRTLFHDHPHCFQLMNWAHLFVMFNPGFGYDALSESWDATLRLLLQTKKPIMATSHGSYDLQRDLRNLTFQPGNEVANPVLIVFNQFNSLTFSHSNEES